MRVDRGLAALRQLLLQRAALYPGLPAGNIVLSRSDLAASLPGVTLRLAGGPGSINPGLYGIDVTVTCYTDASWQKAFEMHGEVCKALDRVGPRDVPAPLLWVQEHTAPAPVETTADVYGVRSNFRAICRDSRD